MRKRIPGVLFLIIGVIAFINVRESPRFDSFRTVDVLTLLGSGMWFGMALIALIVGLERPRRAEARKN